SITASAPEIVTMFRAAKELTIKLAAAEDCNKAATPTPTPKALKRLLVECEITRRSEPPKARFKPILTMFTPHSKRQAPTIMCSNISVALMAVLRLKNSFIRQPLAAGCTRSPFTALNCFLFYARKDQVLRAIP